MNFVKSFLEKNSGNKIKKAGKRPEEHMLGKDTV